MAKLEITTRGWQLWDYRFISEGDSIEAPTKTAAMKIMLEKIREDLKTLLEEK